MKSRIKSLPPDLQKAVREQVERQMKNETAWNAHAVIILACWVMYMHYDWGAKRLDRLYHQLIGDWNELMNEYGYDCWYDKILADLKRIGVEVEKDALDLERQEDINNAKRISALSPGQQARLKAIREQTGG